MPSPLPGMDPYLERPDLWTTFRHHLVAGLYQLLLPGLVDRYRARVGVRRFTSSLVLFTSVEKKDHEEDFIEVRMRSDGRLVTVVDVTSPAVRTTAEGREAYLDVRRSAIADRAGYVEIDLVTQGKPTLDFDRSPLPEHDYTMTVTRGRTPERYEIYTATIRKRLPKFKLPLAHDDRDMVVDLQLAVTRAYEQGRFDQLIDYTAPLPPDVRLNSSDRDWLLATIQPPSRR